jgi:hypothetical protein
VPHLERARVVERFVPGNVRTDVAARLAEQVAARDIVWARDAGPEHLPDIVVAVREAAGAGQQRPVRGLADVTVVEPVHSACAPIVEADGNAFVVRVAIQQWHLATGIRNGQPAEWRQDDGLNHREALPRAIRQVWRGLFPIQTMEQLPGRVAQIEERLAILVLEVTPVLGDFDPAGDGSERVRGGARDAARCTGLEVIDVTPEDLIRRKSVTPARPGIAGAFIGRRAHEEQIAQWRAYVSRRQALHGPDVEELEGHLRDQLVALTEAGLAGDEAFLVAVKRMGSLDVLSREFARAHSERLWKQLVIAPDAADRSANTAPAEMLVVLSLAIAAASAIKVPALFGLRIDSGDEPFYLRNASLFVLPLLTIYFVWKRGSGVASGLWLALPFAAGAVFANVFPFPKGSNTEVLTILHLPIALWMAVGFAYVRGRWFDDGGRMNFVRFSGELAI